MNLDISHSAIRLFCALICSLFHLLDHGVSAQSHYEEKCNTHIRFRQWMESKQGRDQTVIAASARPFTETSIVSLSGKFRIHFDTSASSTNLPALLNTSNQRIPGTCLAYADTIGDLFDSVWSAYSTFGFDFPPPDAGIDGPEYDVYILDQSYFGETLWDDYILINPGETVPRYATYIRIDNDFVDKRTKGLPAARVTSAHEFFHALQIGLYGIWDQDYYFYELTAESMEPAIFPTEKDYVFDISRYFANPSIVPLYLSESVFYAGYERAIWGIYLRQKYGIDLIRQIWTTMRSSRPMVSSQSTLRSRSSSLQREFAEFSYWIYFTGTRGDSVHYFKDAQLFPEISMTDHIDVSITRGTIQRTARSFAPNFIRSVKGIDTSSIIIVNVDYDDAIGASPQNFPYTLTVSPQTESGLIALQNGMSYLVTVQHPDRWSVTALAGEKLNQLTHLKPFPNPFDPTCDALMIPISSTENDDFTAVFFDGSMIPVATIIQHPILYNGTRCIRWDGRTASGELAASGIYFYVISGETFETKGKFAIIR